MDKPSDHSHIPFILVLVTLIGIVCVQFFFNFNGLTTETAMDHAQIARNVARGEGKITHWVRPLHAMQAASRAGLNPNQTDEQLQEKERLLAEKGESLIDPQKFTPYALPDLRHAPLNIWVHAAVFAVAKVTDFNMWQMTGTDTMLYLPDRIVAAVSCVFFVLAVLSVYFVIGRMFDTRIACFTALSVTLSDLFLRYAVSGLPQPMMLLFFVWGVYFVYLALQHQEAQRNVLWQIVLSSVCFSLVCLSAWVALWPMIAFAIFVALRFKRNGLYCLAVFGVLALFLAYPLYMNKSLGGGWFGIASYSIYTGLFGNEGVAMNVLEPGNIPGLHNMVVTLIDNILSQGEHLYKNLGNLPLAMIFFIAVFHRFKRYEVNNVKWALAAMWALATVAMALYTDSEQTLSAGQLQLLFAPFFMAYGLAFLFNIIARLQNKELVSVVNGAAPLLALLITALPFLCVLPTLVQVGTLSRAKGFPAWPPYYPQGLNQHVHNQTDPKHFIVTDQPAAVAWYADRKAISLPKLVRQFNALERIVQFHNGKIGGILITPSSTMNMDMRKVSATYGDFAPMALEGQILLQTKDKNPVQLMQHSKALEPLLPRFGTTHSRQYLNGAYMMLYKDMSQASVTPTLSTQ